MAYTVGIPILLLSLSVCGAQAKDIQIMQGGGRHRSEEQQEEQSQQSEVDLEEENQIPFRGWAPCIFLVTFCWSGITMFCLKYYTAQLRPIGLTMCANVLVAHVR